jgi:hypothetical protein
VSIIPTVLSGCVAKACARRLDLPSPPFFLGLGHLKRVNLYFMPESLLEMSGVSGSGPLGADAQIA